MDKEKARILIAKINALYKTIDANTPGISPLERDLMLSYLRQFYETIALSKPQQNPAEREEKRVDSNVKITPLQKKVEPVRAEEAISSKLIGPEKQNPTGNPSAENHFIEPSVAPFPQADIPAPQGINAPYEKDLISLFDWQEPGNLAERLANTPLSVLDLTTFSMNEKLLYENDLFKKNRVEMEEAIKMLNNFTNFETAKSFLLPLGMQHEWYREERKEAAKSFINIVRRRFL